MKRQDLFKLAWEYAAAAVEKFGGKKSDYFRPALEYVRDWYKEGKTKEEVREEIYSDILFVKPSTLPILDYETYFRKGKVLNVYTEGGHYNSFWFINQGKGAARPSQVDVGAYPLFEDSELHTVQEFLEDDDVVTIISNKLNANVKYIEHLGCYVYADLYDKMVIEGVEIKAPVPDEYELEAMREYDEEQRMKKYRDVDVPF